METGRSSLPRVTVAAVIVRDGKYLLIEEESERGAVLNQPAGHLDPGDSLQDAVTREALEESAYAFAPTALLGIYQYRDAAAGLSYVRFAFTGEITSHDPARALDTGILRALWLTRDEAREMTEHHRSPLVMTCIDDHAAGKRHPLDLLAFFSA